MVPAKKKQRDGDRSAGGHEATLERFQAIIRRVASKEDERSSLVTEIACVVGAVLLLGWGHTARSMSDIDGVQAPFAELLVPLPYFLILFGTWTIYYDAERALHEASLGTYRPFWSRAGFILHNARQVLLFILLPVILFTTNQTLERWWPEVGNTLEFRIGSMIALFGLVILMPLVIRPLLGLLP